MHPLDPFLVMVIYGIAILTAYVLNLRYTITSSHGRYENIDGLRGFLAIGVFIHHTSVWYQYLHINSWERPRSDLFNQLGQTSVSFFFMITSFLFITKLLNAGDKKFDWKAFFTSRIYRLAPMYYASIFVLVLIVMIITKWSIDEGFLSFMNDLFYWGTFTIIKGSDINNMSHTEMINAGVIWSLPFEWLFSFSLPVISILILKERPSNKYIFISIAFIVMFFAIHGIDLHHIYSFCGGAIAPFMIRYGHNHGRYVSTKYSIMVIILLALIPFFRTSNDFLCKTLIILIFTIVALGNSMFGILKSTAIRFLGEICYSTYLIHGIVLFVVIYFYYGIDNARSLSDNAYCLTVISITPLLVIISFLTYRFIERPFMDMAKKRSIPQGT